MNDGNGKTANGTGAQIFSPPNTVRQKVTGSGGPTPEMLAKADAAIKKMTEDYPSWAINEVDRLGELIQSEADDQSRDQERLKEAYKLSHDMRGQGGSFGYPMITGVAGSFCNFVNSLDAIDGKAVDILQAHVKAMRAVLQNRIAGDGGPIGAKILDGLNKAVAKYAASKG